MNCSFNCSSATCGNVRVIGVKVSVYVVGCWRYIMFEGCALISKNRDELCGTSACMFPFPPYPNLHARFMIYSAWKVIGTLRNQPSCALCTSPFICYKHSLYTLFGVRVLIRGNTFVCVCSYCTVHIIVWLLAVKCVCMLALSVIVCESCLLPLGVFALTVYIYLFCY